MDVELQHLMAPIKELEVKMNLAQQIANGTTKLKSFSFNGVEYGKKKLQEGYEQLIAEQNTIYENAFKDWDQAFFSSHIILAGRHGKEERLQKLVSQQGSITDLFRQVLFQKNTFLHTLTGLQTRDDVTEAEVNNLMRSIIDTGREMNTGIEGLKDTPFVAISNIDDIDELIKTIHPDGKLPVAYGRMFENGSFDKFLHAVEQALQQLQRIEQKNMAEILVEFEEVKNVLS